MSWRLTATDPAPFTVINTTGTAPYLLVADHAGDGVPAALADLGLAPAAFRQHIAVDIGVRALITALSQRLDAVAVLANYSRLVIDLNRTLDSSTCVPSVSDGWTIPGNEALSESDREARTTQIFAPYHEALRARLETLETQHTVAGIIAIHSFTPIMGGQRRPWHVGVLWNADERLTRQALHDLGQQPGLVVGDNEPYSARGPEGFTMPEHAERPGRPHLLFEVRQDLLQSGADIARWCELLSTTIENAWASLADAPGN